jgi:hypothetical protein
MHRGGIIILVILMRKNIGSISTTLIGTMSRTVLPEFTPTMLNGRRKTVAKAGGCGRK